MRVAGCLLQLGNHRESGGEGKGKQKQQLTAERKWGGGGGEGKNSHTSQREQGRVVKLSWKKRGFKVVMGGEGWCEGEGTHWRWSWLAGGAVNKIHRQQLASKCHKV